jgi:hypothetical protein
MKYFAVVLTIGLLGTAASLAVQDEKDLRSGLIGEYYNVGKKMEKMPDLGGIFGLKPVSRHVDRMIDFGPEGSVKNFSDANLKTFFAVRWTGWIKVPKDGSYTFFLKCTDMSKMWIDGKLVLEHEGKPVMEENHKTLDLKAGNHEFKVEYMHNEGDKMGCCVSWEYEGMKKQVIPGTTYWHTYEKDLDGPAK